MLPTPTNQLQMDTRLLPTELNQPRMDQSPTLLPQQATVELLNIPNKKLFQPPQMDRLFLTLPKPTLTDKLNKSPHLNQEPSVEDLLPTQLLPPQREEFLNTLLLNQLPQVVLLTLMKLKLAQTEELLILLKKPSPPQVERQEPMLPKPTALEVPYHTL